MKLILKIYLILLINFYFALSINFAQENNYTNVKSNIEKKRIEFNKMYKEAISKNEKELIIKKAQNFLFDSLKKDILPVWLDTPWSFNGQTRTPGTGSIACGYFVVHVLQDMSFRMPSKMARQPSENIIKNIIGKKNIKIFVNSASMDIIKKWIIKNGEGIYIIGLDIHIGFIINKSNRITFIHSSYYNPPLKVVEQDIMERSPLADSKYRVLGKILDDKMMKKWINGDLFPLKYDFFRK